MERAAFCFWREEVCREKFVLLIPPWLRKMGKSPFELRGQRKECLFIKGMEKSFFEERIARMETRSY